MALQSNKDRIITVDIMRFLAAALVLFEHLDFVRESGHLATLLGYQELLLPRVSPIFFFLAGYFVCRNISWKKALNNAWWCLAPFVLWNGIAIGVAYAFHPDMLEGRDIFSLFGLSSLTEGPEHGMLPINVPLWFMRDLVFLFLLSPLLCKISRILVPVLVLLALLPQTAHLFYLNSRLVLTMNSVAFFSFGCFLQTFGKETQHRCLTSCSPVCIISYIAVITGVYLYGVFSSGLEAIPTNTFCQNIISLLFLHQTARWLEIHSPLISKAALKLAPATFLTFAGHGILYTFIPKDCALLPLLPIPFITFILLVMMFFALKRWCRPLLHLVAHYKLRAEDVKSACHKGDARV